MSFEKLLYELRDGVGYVTLNRPDVLNAMDIALREELWTILDIAEADDDVRVIVFRGAGDRAFSAGADITEFGSSPSFVESRRSRHERDLWGRLAHFPKPMIAAIHGYALGAGLELALLCDVRIAADDAVLGLPEIALAYLPSAGGSQTLPRTIGAGRALDMILTGDPIDARQALEWGLVYEVVPVGELDARVEALAGRLAALPTAAVRAMKASLREGMELSLQGAIELEARLGARLASSI